MKKFLKIAGILVAALIIFVLGAFFYVNRGGFIKAHIVPKLAEQLKMPVIVEDAEFSYDSLLSLKGIVVGEAGNPVVKADEITVRYDLWSLISDKDLHVKELKLNNVFAKIDERLLPPASENTEISPSKVPAKTKASNSEPALSNYLIENVVLENLNVSYKMADGTYAELECFALNLKELKPNSPFLIELKSSAQFKQAEQPDYRVGQMNFNVKGELDQNFQPKNVQLDLLLADLIGDVHEALKLEGREFKISGDIAREGEVFNIKAFQLQEIFQQQDAASIKLDGFFNPINQNCKFSIAIDKVGQSILALANGSISKVPALTQWQENLKKLSDGKIVGLGQSELAYKGVFEQTNGEITTKGLLSLNSFPLTKGHGRSLALLPTDLGIDYDLSFQPANQQVQVRAVKVELKQDKKLVLDLSNQQPLSLSLSKLDGSAMDITGRLEILSLDLSQANSFLPENLWVKDGFLNSRVTLAKTAKDIKGNLDLALKSLDLTTVNEAVKDLSISLSSALDLKGFNELVVSDASLSLTKKQEDLLRVFYEASHNLSEQKSTWNVKSLELNPNIEKVIPSEIKKSIPISNINLKVKALKGEFSPAGIKVKGQVQSDNLVLETGKKVSPTSQFALSFVDQKVTVDSFKLWLKSNFHQVVQATVQGQVDLTKKTESKIEITVPTLVDGFTFQQAFVKEKTASETPKPESSPEEKVPQDKQPVPTQIPVDEKPIFIVTKLQQVSYKLFTVKDIYVNAEIYSDRYILHPSKFSIWGTELETSASYHNKAVPDYKFNLKSNKVNLLPIMNQFAPDMAEQVQGVIQIPELSLAGSLGDNPFKTMKGDMKLNIDSLNLNDFVTGIEKVQKKKSLLGGLTDVVRDITGLGGSELLSQLTGINPNKLSFGQSDMNLNLDGGELSSKDINFKGEKYNFKIAGLYNILSNDGTVTVDAGISGLSSIDRKFAGLFKAGEDGLRYLPPVTIPTADFKDRPFFAGLAKMSGRYFKSIGSSLVSSINPLSSSKKEPTSETQSEQEQQEDKSKKKSKTERTIEAVEGILNLF